MTIPENTKRIPLSQGQFAIVDADDYDRLMLMNWHVHRSQSSNTLYAITNIDIGLLPAKTYNGRTYNPRKIRTSMKMHRFIMRASSAVIIDHRDGNGLHNWKANLRAATNGQNLMNSTKQARGSSKYKGVRLNRNRWDARIQCNKKAVYLGMFDTELEAALAYNEAAVRYFGQFARLNDLSN